MLVAGAASSLAFMLVPFVARVDVLVVLMVIDGLGWGTVTTLMLASRSATMSASTAMGWYVGVTGLGHALAA